MNMDNQLKKLNNAVSALQGSQARSRLLRLFDEGSFVEIDRFARDADMPSQVVVGYGTVEGCPVYAFSQDKQVYRGAIGKAQAAKICKVYQLASQNGAPLVGVFDSDGAKLNEGIDAMDAIAEILYASNNLSGVVPQIAVVAGACVGSSAIIAANSDFVVMSKDADYYLNPGDQNAAASIVADDTDEAIDMARRLISLLPSNNLDVPAAFDVADVQVKACSSIDDVINAVADDGMIINIGQGKNETVLASVGGNVCGLLTLAEDKISADEASRLARFIRLCDAFSLPVISFVDTSGFASLQGAAKLSHAYAESTTVKITTIVGKAYGAAYIAAAGKSAGADVVLAWPTAVILPLAPETAIHIFENDKLADMKDPVEDRKKLADEYAQANGDVFAAASNGVTDIVSPNETKSKLIAFLKMLESKRVSRNPKKHSNIVL
ncbi:MAG: carboxyl transferase domain-containing protein [Oscillospiraceae bacterium]|jgi:acetyl-CoA carboxylase carboxyltransferase component|nr:carboxyl transferase domain-containing protein [Oscillospiraceae bacterium]